MTTVATDTVAISPELYAYFQAAADLASTVSTLDRIATDPRSTADRTPAADRYRAESLRDSLAKFRAHERAIREGYTL